MDEWLDEDGYPTDDCLDTIRTWPCERYGELLKKIEDVWWHGENGFLSQEQEKQTVYCLHTWGWSGNESLIAALEDNRLFWIMCWEQSRRGGHYTFEVPASVL